MRKRPLTSGNAHGLLRELANLRKNHRTFAQVRRLTRKFAYFARNLHQQEDAMTRELHPMRPAAAPAAPRPDRLRTLQAQPTGGHASTASGTGERSPARHVRRVRNRLVRHRRRSLHELPARARHRRILTDLTETGEPHDQHDRHRGHTPCRHLAFPRAGCDPGPPRDPRRVAHDRRSTRAGPRKRAPRAGGDRRRRVRRSGGQRAPSSRGARHPHQVQQRDWCC